MENSTLLFITKGQLILTIHTQIQSVSHSNIAYTSPKPQTVLYFAAYQDLLNGNVKDFFRLFSKPLEGKEIVADPSQKRIC